MVAKTVTLPNIRELFIPDPGMTIINCDLKQADAQVVAWEADDDVLKAIFRDPKADLHRENCIGIFGEFSDRNRQLAKIGVHATNYGASAKTLATALGITVYQAERFQSRWFQIHPKIKAWHRDVELRLQTKRMVTNKFGNRRVYFGRVEGLLAEALAWIPQSTVALVIDRGLVNLDENVKDVELLLQVHDSLTFQVPTHKVEELKPIIKKNLEIVVPYPDPLIIPVDIETSEKSWGECEKVTWG